MTNIQVIVDSHIHFSFGEEDQLRKLFFEAIRFVRRTKRIASKNSFLSAA
jgi:hypothetical protein